MKRMTLRQNLINVLGVPLQEKIVSAGSVRTFYFSAGSGKPVILVHGHSVTGAISWGNVIPSLSKVFKVIAPDVVGYGETDKPFAPYDRPFFSNWLNNFLKIINIEKASLVGISQGGAISLQFALDYPEKVDRLVLINSAGLGKWMPPVGFAMSMAFRYIFPSHIASKWNSRYMVKDPKKINKDLINYGIKVTRNLNCGRIILQGRGKAASPFPEDRLKRISQPTLFLCGAEDRVMPHCLSINAQKIIPNAEIKIIPEAGHSLFFDQPEAFTKEVMVFLNRKKIRQMAN